MSILRYSGFLHPTHAARRALYCKDEDVSALEAERDALAKRLEAAEAVCAAVYDNLDEGAEIASDQYDAIADAYDAWRAASRGDA